MSLESALSIAMSGISTASTQLELTASNISNASTVGYTKKTTVTTAAVLGKVGGGVQVSGFTRSTNAALFTTLTSATANASKLSTLDSYFQQVQDILGTSSSDNPSLSEYVTDFVNSWTELSASPESLVCQQQVIQNATNLADEVNRLAEQVEDLDRQCYTEINGTVDDLNSYLEQIQDLNTKIAMAVNSGLSGGNLEDQRDQLILKVAEITDVTVLTRGSGQVALYTATGYQLVDGPSVRTFEYDGTNITSSTNPGLSLNDALTGGSLEALVDFRAETTPASADPNTSVIQKLRGQLDGVFDLFTDTATTAASSVDSFAGAYASIAAEAGELDTSFFTGTSRTDFSVNASLLDGTATVKTSIAATVTDAMLDSTRTITYDGISLTGASYSSYVTSVYAGFQQAATNVATLSDSADTTQSYLEEKFTNETAVSVDDELVNLVTFQNAYAASAHVMSVINTLFAKLENLL
ncbi:MAG: flagellar hook-associated protein FlgK [Alphaproteobacteria bacterium]|nr:flagellar hook-associated protein FlgK [Alphaproteobacteria bacterium]